MKTNVDKSVQPEKITKKDVRKAWFLWWLFAEMSNSYERLQTLAFCASLTPILKKLYKTKESLSEALKRHLNFFNTQAVWGGTIHGITIAMEEQKANGADIPAEAITAIKTGLMGPLAGIGDSIDWGTIRPIIIGLFLPLAAAGNPMGAIGFAVVYTTLTCIQSAYLHDRGYTLGREAISQLLGGEKINQLLAGASVLGLFMMGALTANFVKLPLALEINMEGANPIVIQEILDGIAPGILPLAVVFGIYAYLSQRGLKTTRVLLVILALCLVGSFMGLV